MCGIAGWVAFDRSLRTEQLVLDAMTDTMACRGPDDRGTWLSERAAIGNRRLAIVDAPGGHQPMTVDTPRGPVVMTYSGEAYNFRELRTELAVLGHRFTTQSDTEVVLRGYLQWGTEVARRLNGMYAFAIWDARHNKLVMIRDRFGIKPLFYYPTRDGVLFGSEPKAIFANPLSNKVVGISGWREFYGRIKTPGHGIWEGMYEVKPGAVVAIAADGRDEYTYWSLPEREHRDDLKTTIATTRSLLERSISRQLGGDVTPAALLSGGLDSSTIVAIASQLMSGRNKPINTFGIDFAGHAEHFIPDLLQLEPDAPYARLVATQLGTNHTELVLQPNQVADPRLLDKIIQARDFPPPGIGDTEVSRYLLFQAIRQHSTVALSGDGADELFGGYKQFFNPEVQRTNMFPWLAQFMQELHEERNMFLDDFVRALDIETYLRDNYNTASNQISRREGETDHEYRMRQSFRLHLERFVRHPLDITDRTSMAVGVEVRVPYLDHELVEYVYNTPWSFKTHDGREKSLLRSAAADLLTPSVLWRQKSPFPRIPHPQYLTALRERTKALLATDHSVFSLVRRDIVQKTVTLPVSQLSPTARYWQEHTLELASWINQYRPTIRFC